MVTVVQKWGNSLAVRIPKAIREETGLRQGAPIKVRAENGRIVMTPEKGRRYDLASLVRGIRKSNLHGEVSTGNARGREAW